VVGIYGIKSKLIYDDYPGTVPLVSEACEKYNQARKQLWRLCSRRKVDYVSVTALSYIQFLLDSFEGI